VKPPKGLLKLKKKKLRQEKCKKIFIQKETTARCRWLTPVILTTQEAEIRRITVQSQPGRIA
jgi:hypothetical protein